MTELKIEVVVFGHPQIRALHLNSKTKISQTHLAVSIINYRTGDLTLACVASVLADLGDTDGQVVVVDNASGDGSAEVIEAWISAQTPPVPVTLVRSETNSGFSGGHNQGIAAVDADYYLVLNSDAVLRPGFIKAILDVADANPKAGLIAPRIEYDDGQQQINCFRFPGPANELIRGAATGPVTHLFRHRDIALYPPFDVADIEWASFACILLRGEMVQDVGMMDEGYFLYFEDTEYCHRAARSGWAIAYADAAVVVHFRGGSGPVKKMAAAKKRLPKYFYASRSRFLYQAHGWFGLMAANLAWVLGRCIAYLRLVAGRPVPRASQKELLDIWTNVFTPLGDRRDGGH